MPVKAALYCRLSEEDKNKQQDTDDSESIQNQKSMLKDYADAQGWEVYDIYSDDDYAGADRKRPEFNRLIRDARCRKFNVILCKAQSRFTRELELVEKYINGLFPLWGIRFVSIIDNADTANKGNKKSRQINGLVNEWYLEDMSENIRSVLTNKRKNGMHIGSFALYGYKKDPAQKGHLIIDEEAAAIVREVFSLFAKGFGKTAIARSLNDRGIPSPAEYKRLRGLRYKQPKQKNAALWKYYTVASMLNNEIYIGNMVQGKYGSVSYKTKQNKPRPKSEWYRAEGTHEPIIDLALWETVQSLQAQKTKPFNTGTVGLFARKARCAGCGYAMRSSKNHDRHYLRCSCRHVSKDACAGSFISVEKLEQLVINELNWLLDHCLDTKRFEQSIELSENLQCQKSRLLSDLASYEKRISEYANGIRELYLDKANGLISEQDFAEFSKDFSEEKNRLARIAKDTQKQLDEINEKIASGDSQAERLQKYTRFEHLKREVVEMLIDHILVGSRIPGTRDVPIEIHWKL